MKKLFCFLLLIIPTFAQAQSEASVDLLKYIDENIFSLDMEFMLEMKMLKKEKVKRTYLMKVFKRNNKLRIDFLKPSIEKDRRMLNDAENLWMFLPRSGRLIKIPYKQSFLGGDASNRDIMRISYVEDYDILEDVTDFNDTLLLLKLKAKDQSTAYNRVNLYIDKKTQVPVKQEMMSLSEKIIKTIDYEDVKEIAGHLLPHSLTITNMLKKDSKTILAYKDVSRKVDKSDAFFTTSALKK